MTDREAAPTHSAFLELQEERLAMREGYGFLDEKRLLLASEILRQLALHDREMDQFRAACGAAAAALRAAVARHGLEDLMLHPPASALVGTLQTRARSVLGVLVHDSDCALAEPAPTPEAAACSPEAARARLAFRALIPHGARLATLAGNLERLRLEYARTARRARALEDVLLPEIDERIRTIDSALEELEREEAIRVRRIACAGK